MPAGRDGSVGSDGLRLLIVISARNAEATLASVLDLIPRDFVHGESMHVLVVDDAAPDGPTKHTAIGVGLNLLLLAMIGYGYWRSEDWKWTWVLVGIPITIVTLRYAWHLLRSRP